jgi:hypothetical protein
MGWLFKPGSNRKGLIEERQKGWEHQQANGTLIKSSCLAACYRGNPFSGVLWSVWERTFEKDGQQVEPTQRWIVCDLLRYDRCDEGWGYKDMEESMHPYYYSCPLGYLEMVPIDQFGGNAEWRGMVHEHHERLKEKRQQRRLARTR